MHTERWDFLRARLIEDEGIARAATSGCWCCYPLPEDSTGATVGTTGLVEGTHLEYRESVITAIDHYTDDVDGCDTREAPVSRVDAQHMARQDPKRTLAEVEVRRRLLWRHRPVEDYPPGESVCVACDKDGNGEGDWPCAEFRILELPWLDHPDYRPDWRSDAADSDPTDRPVGPGPRT